MLRLTPLRPPNRIRGGLSSLTPRRSSVCSPIRVGCGCWRSCWMTESSVGRLADLAGLSESGASHALRLLRAHRIVQARRDGRMVYYRLADEHVRQLLLIALQHAEHSVLLHPEL